MFYSFDRLLAAPLIIESSEKKTLNASLTSGTVSAASVEILECLIDRISATRAPTVEYVELLKFRRKEIDEPSAYPLGCPPDFKLNFKYSEKTVRQGPSKRYNHPRTVVEITLQPCDTEIDISIVDRTSNLLISPEVCKRSSKFTARHTRENQQTCFFQAVENPTILDNKTDVKVTCEGEELMIPGDKQEMAEFIEYASRNSRIQLEISLPCASMQLCSKHQYEVIYNRINTDMFLWEPTFPKGPSSDDIYGVKGQAGIDLASTLLQESIYQPFSMCRSGVHYESDSDSEDTDGQFYSVYESHQRKKRRQQPKPNPLGQSSMTVTLSIGQGVITVYTPVRDSVGNAIPQHHGELQVMFDEGSLFSVSGYKGLVASQNEVPQLRFLGTPPPAHLDPTIYRSDPGAVVGTSGPVGTGSSNSLDMLTVAIKVQVDEAASNLKTFRVAARLHGATLRHRMCTSNQSWFTQIVDFFDVQDYPVSGYDPPGVITELHMHLWDCAVDYRPLHLPLKSMVTVGSFSISSNIAAQTSTSTLRFIAEDAALYISNKNGSRHASPPVDLRKDYPPNGVPEVRSLTSEPVRVVDNHFAVPIGKTDQLRAPEHFPDAVLRYTLCEMTIIWHMYGGQDFGNPVPQNRNQNAKKQVKIDDNYRTGCSSCPSSPPFTGYHFARSPSDTHISGTGSLITAADTSSLENRFKSRSTLFTSPKTRGRTQLSWQARGGPGRQHEMLMELQLNKVKFRHEVYPDNTKEASRQILLVSDIEVRDRLASSQINKFLYQYTSASKPKQSHANMIRVVAVHVRPDPKLSIQECSLKVTLLPLRLNIDQDSLLFLINFFTDISGLKKEDGSIQGPTSRHSTPTHQAPVMTVNVGSSSRAPSPEPQTLLILLDEDGNSQSPSRKSPMSYSERVADKTASTPIFFRSFLFSREVLIKLDYQGKRVDMTHGPLPGLLLGLGQLQNSEFRLKRISYRHGLTIVRVASEEHEQKGVSGAVGGVLRQIPGTVVKPIIIASEATSNVLGGMRSQLVPDARREADEKWRNED
ncbi:hypothetical protein C0J52_03803 [Blattella germanica]|nr:hypothetical protein C0J52_03803 [Blattella germanica]